MAKEPKVVKDKKVKSVASKVKKTKDESATKVTKVAKAVRGKKHNQDGFNVALGLDGLRIAPTIYLGELGDDMAFRMVKEVVDNVYDENRAGRCKVVEVIYHHDLDLYIVADEAGGIPTTVKTLSDGTKESIMVSAFSRAHAGGKFNDDAYKTSAGTHGIGVAAVNAMSDRIRVWSNFEKKTKGMEYAKGRSVVDLKKWDIDKDVAKCLQDDPKTYGTVVAWTPDQTIISADSARGKKLPKSYRHARIDLKRTREWLISMSQLNPGFEIRFTVIKDKKIKRETFLNSKGLADVVRQLAEDRELTLDGKPYVFNNDFVTLAISWVDHSDAELLQTFVNASPTIDGGWHVTGFRDALENALKPYIKKKAKGQKSFTASDLLVGAIGLFDFRMHGAQYTSQVKDKLASRVEKEVYEHIANDMATFFLKNKGLAGKIIKRAETMTKGREELQKLVKSMSEAKKKVKGNALPANLTVAPNAKPHERELFVCEGESAGNKVDQARDNKYQEVYKTTGKPLNGLNASLAKILAHKGVQGYLTAIGADLKSLDLKAENPTLPVDKLRVGNVMLLSDADPDGPLHGDTIVETSHGRHTIKQLAESWSEDFLDFTVPVRTDIGTRWGVATAPRITTVVDSSLVLTFDDGTEFNCTHSHRWETANGMVRAKDLVVGDTILGTPNNVITSIQSINHEPTPFYCLTVPRYGRFLLPTKDGYASSSNCHINALWLAVTYRLLPDLMKQGRVWVVKAPLFMVMHEGKMYGGDTFDECRAKAPKAVKDHEIGRLKGWGEAETDMLVHATTNPATRKLIQINPFVSKEHERFFRSVVGDDALSRRRLLGLEE